MNKDNVIVIAGPTAVGKSEVGIKLAAHFKGEILSGDSMQIYKGLDIGTAKVPTHEQAGIPHYFIDECRPDEPYSVSSFQNDAKNRIQDINQRGKLPFVVGGTGFYIRSVLQNLDFHGTPADEDFRKDMEQFAQQHGADALHNKLRQKDKAAAELIHPNNIKKVIRALEIQSLSGHTKQPFNAQDNKTSPYDYIVIGLTMDRDVLYGRINQRVDKMLENGLLEEAEWLFDNFPANVQAAQAIGYKEFFPYFRGEKTFEEAVRKLKKNSRNFAKRQITWFRNKENVEWFDVTTGVDDEKIEKMIHLIEGKFNCSSNNIE